MIENGTTGLKTWSASIALAHWFLHHPGTTNNPFTTLVHLHTCPAEEVRGRKVLELGSGTGFLGIIIAILQLQHNELVGEASGLCLTDVNESVLQQCHRNCQLTPSESFRRHLALLKDSNYSRITDGVFRHLNMQIRLLDWNDALEANPQGVLTDEGVHIVTGADLVHIYSLSHHDLCADGTFRYSIHQLSPPWLRL